MPFIVVNQLHPTAVCSPMAIGGKSWAGGGSQQKAKAAASLLEEKECDKGLLSVLCSLRGCRLHILTSYCLTCEKVTMDWHLDRLGKHMEKNSAITKLLYPDRDLSEYEKIILLVK